MSHYTFNSQKGQTPLMIACDHGFEKIAELLIHAGADVNIPNNVSEEWYYRGTVTGTHVVFYFVHHNCIT